MLLVGLEHLHITSGTVQVCSSITYSAGMKFKEAITIYINMKVMLTRNKVSLFCLSEGKK